QTWPTTISVSSSALVKMEVAILHFIILILKQQQSEHSELRLETEGMLLSPISNSIGAILPKK
ncbi:17681_t:CDS:1, partial [Rhizophagus irregularis]